MSETRTRPLRVIFLTHNFPRFPGDVSGSFLATLARGLIGRGHSVVVIAPSDQGDAGEPDFEGVRVRRIRYASAGREILAYRGTMVEAARSPMGMLTTLSLGRALRRATREELARGGDLVHAHWWVPGGLAAPPEARLVLTVHGTDSVLLARSGLVRLAARPLLRRARVLTTVAAPAAAVLARTSGRPLAEIRIQPMPIETSRYTVWSGGGGGLFVVARLTRQKRVDLALQALTHLSSTLRLTVIGDGPERGNLEALRDRLGLTSRVQLIGAQSPARVAEFLRAADVALFPAVQEGFGLAAAEALMAGVPVVACVDGGGVLDVVPATGAGRHSIPDPESIARAVQELLSDPASRVRAQEAGLRWREQLSPDHVAGVVEQWYHEALRA